MAKKSKISSTKPRTNIKFKDSIKTKLIAILLAVAAIPLTIAVIVRRMRNPPSQRVWQP